MRSQISSCLDRRVLLKALTAGAGLLGASRLSLISAAAAGPTPLVNHAETVFVPGQFFWDLGRAPEGRVVIIVSIPRQLVFVYRNGALIGLSTCSTGMPGHSTPAGMFTVINKFKVHRSAKYGDDMPNTLRLTRRGIALHGGDIPGYPTSHGCVHLPLPFADDLFELTATGTPVVIGGDPAHRLVSGAGVAPAASSPCARRLAPSRRPAPTLTPRSSSRRRTNGSMWCRTAPSSPQDRSPSRTRGRRLAAISLSGAAAILRARRRSLPAAAFSPSLPAPRQRTRRCWSASTATPGRRTPSRR
jgi:hypothetical protein